MGNAIQRYEYDSFGNIKHTPHPRWITQSYTYTGREMDYETGLYYYRARYYDPKVGRFITKDPIGFGGSDVNLYVYVGNNPINLVDPTGQNVYSCVRPLSGVPFSELIKKYLGLGHNYLWVDRMTQYTYGGWGLAPANGYAALFVMLNPLLPVPAMIEPERSMQGDSISCTMVTDDPDRECKIEKIINEERNTWQIYALAWHNCYHWVNYVLGASL